MYVGAPKGLTMNEGMLLFEAHRRKSQVQKIVRTDWF